MIQPQIAIITSIGEAHSEFFTSTEEIARAKAEIFEGMAKGGAVILNQDNPYYDLLFKRAHAHGLQVYGFGQSEKADFRLLSWEGEAEKSRVIAEIGGKRISYILTVPGAHWVLNSLAVLGAVHLAGAPVEKAAQSLAVIEAPPGRGKRYKGEFTVIDESYNANPSSMRAALAVLGQSQGKRKIAVLGDMRELGELSRVHHEELLAPILKNKVDLVFCCGPFMTHLYERLPRDMKGGYALTALELVPLVLQAIEPGDTVSVKASLGTRVKPIVEALVATER
jgi:UDP-N-acetylmuramoyl-tripeptide--D-alanyl-D-alanine ligase